jgi:hypothetical protein
MSIALTALIGAAAGLHAALYGAYKDSPHESFLARRFAREIVTAFLLLCAIGGERMCNELLFKILVRGYVPGTFRSMTAPFAEWMVLRRHFLLPYGATWALSVAFFFGI